MQKLTATQIGLIRLSLNASIKNGDAGPMAPGVIDILDILEFGCGVSVTTCEEESANLIDDALEMTHIEEA